MAVFMNKEFCGRRVEQTVGDGCVRQIEWEKNAFLEEATLPYLNTISAEAFMKQ